MEPEPPSFVISSRLAHGDRAPGPWPMRASDPTLTAFETTVAGFARDAARSERLAGDYARLAAYLSQEGRTSAVDLFESLSRHHAIRALEDRARLAAAVHERNGGGDPEQDD